jgi:AAA ATPase domain
VDVGRRLRGQPPRGWGQADRPSHGELSAEPLQELFVGRQSELARLHRRLARARAGTPGLVLIEGPPGIGKTALVRRFLDVAGAQFALRASGEEAEAGLPLGVLAQLMAEAPAALPNNLSVTCKRDGGPVDPLVAGAALVDLLGKLQGSGPSLVLVDDAHWADCPSLRALTFALRHVRMDRLLALVVVRESTDPRLPEGLRRMLWDEHTLQLSLGGLDADDLHSLSAQLGVGPLSGRAAARLKAHTDGHPLHARVLLEQLPAAAFDDQNVPLPAPRSFALSVLARLAVCPVDVQELVAAASVLDTHCLLHQAAELAQLDDPVAALEQSIYAGLLVEEPSTRTVRFAHPLLRAAVFQHLGVARRAALHTRAAALAEDDTTRLRHRAAAAVRPNAELAADLARLGRQLAVAAAWDRAALHRRRRRPRRANRPAARLPRDGVAWLRARTAGAGRRPLH